MASEETDPAERLQHFATRLIRIARSTHKDRSLSSAQYSVMALLNEAPRTNIVELARREGVAHPTVSRVIAGLIRLGLVVREPAPGDRRSGLLSLTAAGQKLYREVAERRVALFRMLLAQLRPETVSEVLAVTERMAAPLEKSFRRN